VSLSCLPSAISSGRIGSAFIKFPITSDPCLSPQNPNCTSDFIQSIHFRGQYSSFFFAPLLAMIFIYAHIFVIIRRHQASRRALTQHSTISSMHGGTRNSQNAATIESRYNQPCSENCRQVPPNGHRWSNPRPNHQSISSRSNRTISNEPDQSSTVTKNVKVRRALFKCLTFINRFDWQLGRHNDAAHCGHVHPRLDARRRLVHCLLR